MDTEKASNAGCIFLCDVAICPSCDRENTVNHHGRCTKPADQRIIIEGICQFVENMPPTKRKRATEPPPEIPTDIQGMMYRILHPPCPICGGNIKDGVCESCGLEVE